MLKENADASAKLLFLTTNYRIVSTRQLAQYRDPNVFAVDGESRSIPACRNPPSITCCTAAGVPTLTSGRKSISPLPSKWLGTHLCKAEEESSNCYTANFAKNLNCFLYLSSSKLSVSVSPAICKRSNKHTHCGLSLEFSSFDQ